MNEITLKQILKFGELCKTVPELDLIFKKFEPNFQLKEYDLIFLDAFFSEAFNEINLILFKSDSCDVNNIIQNKFLLSDILTIMTCIGFNPQIAGYFYDLVYKIFNTNIFNKVVILELIEPIFFISRLIEYSIENDKIENILTAITNDILLFDTTTFALKTILKYLHSDISNHKKETLLKIIRNSLNSNDPVSYFHFQGKPGTGIFIPKLKNLNINCAYSITIWFNLRDLEQKQSCNCLFDEKSDWTPFLFQFCSQYGTSIAIFFKFGKIIFEYNNGLKKVSLEHEYQIKTDAWHLVTLAYNCRDNNPVFSIYIDEKLLGLHEIDLSDSEPILSSCFIGKSNSNKLCTQFVGSISHLFIWNVSLSHYAVAAIYSLTPVYQGLFYENLEYDFKKYSGVKLKILMGAFAKHIICAFSARRASDNICHDISMNFVDSRCEAVYSNEVWVIHTQKLINSLRSLGGVDALFSFFEIICPKLPLKCVTFPKIITLFFYFINDLASNSNYFRQCFVKAKLYKFISWRLNSLFDYFPPELIECVLESSKVSLHKKENKKIFKIILLNFLLNDVWWSKYSNHSLQMAIIFMLGERVYNVDYCYYLKNYIGLTPLIQILNSFCARAQTDDSILIIKSLLMRLISQVLTQGGGVQTSELNLLIYHFSPIKDHLYDLSSIFIELSSHNKESFSSAFCASNSIMVFNELLASTDFDLMIKGMVIITIVINNASESAFDHIVNKFNVWSILIYRLKDKFSLRIYHQLLQIMIGADSLSILSTNDISKLKTITIKKPIMIQVISFLIHLGVGNASGTVEVDTINNIASDFIAIIKKIITYDKSSCGKIYAKNGWQGWLVIFLKILNRHPKFHKIKQSLIVIIFCIIKHGLVNFDHGWITFVDLLGYLHYVNYYEHFGSILKLINASSNEMYEILQQIFPITEDYNFGTTVSMQESGRVSINKKHKIHLNINSFNLQDLTMQMLYHIINGLKSEYLNYSTINLNRFCPSSIFLKNTANIILLVSDLIINAFGGLNHLLDIAILSTPETPLISPSIRNCNLHLMNNILNAIYSIVESFFTEKSFSFKKMEESLDLEPTELLKISLRVFLCRFLIKVCVGNFILWNISYPKQKILNNINIQLKDFFLQESQCIEKSSNIFSPLVMRKLISRDEHLVIREILVQKSEYVGDFHSIAEICVYVLGKVMLSQYMRIIEYVPQESGLIFSTFTISEIVKASLKDIAAILYEIFVSHSYHFHQILPTLAGESILEAGFKNMTLGFDTLEFVMLLTSQRWNEVFIKIFSPEFYKFCQKSKKYSLYTIDQIDKRCCFSADLYLQSALLIRNSMIEVTQVPTLNKNHFKSLKKPKDFSKTLGIDYINLTRQINFFTGKIENSSILMNIILFGLYRLSKSAGYYELNDIEDYLRRKSNLSLCKYNTIDCKSIATTRVKKHAENEEIELSTMKLISSTPFPIISSQQSCTAITSSPEFNSSRIEILNKNTLISMNFVSFRAKIIFRGMCINGDINVTVYNQIVEYCIDQNSLSDSDKNLCLMLTIDNFKFEYSQVIRIFARFYAQEANSVEIFLKSGRSYFFCMENYHCVAALVDLLPSIGVGKDYGLPPTRDVSFYSASTMFEQSSLPKSWSKGLISNFEYLMFLNTISGRSYNDISQYPIFPWVLSNYESDKIDLNDDKNYRDLSKPVCIVKDGRCKYFQEIFENRSKNTVVAPCFYQKYCSNPEYVTDYLIRLEPFGLMRLNLDSANLFDISLVFESISRMWDNITLYGDGNRELIPEFFYLPEIFDSKKSFITKDGKSVEIPPVQLPPYVKTALDFTRIHLKALESCFVLNNLHKWIDLIFGFAQKGQQAEDFINVYYFLTYESPINQYQIDDQSIKGKIVSKILSGGIVPRQILTKPHFSSQRIPHTPVHDPNILSDLVHIFPISEFGKIIYIGFSLKNDHLLLYLIDSNLKCSSVDLKFDLNETGVIDNFNLDCHKIIETINFDCCSNYIPNFNSFNVPESGHHMISACSYIDNSFRVFDMANGVIVQILEYHNEKVTCVDTDYLISPEDEYYVVTGSQDASICLWNYSSKNHSISRLKSTENPLKLLPLRFLYGHVDPISYINIKARFGLILSCSSLGNVCLHSIDGTLISFLSIVDIQSPKIINVQLTYDGLIIALCSGCSQSQLDIFQHNGSSIINKKLTQEMTLMALDLHGKYCGVAGGDKITVFNTKNFEIFCTYSRKTHIISAIKFINYYNIILVGFESGELSILKSNGWIDKSPLNI